MKLDFQKKEAGDRRAGVALERAAADSFSHYNYVS